MKPMNRLLIIIVALLLWTSSFGQDTLQIDDKTYIGTILSVDSTSSVIYFKDAVTDRQLVLSFKKKGEKPQLTYTTNQYFININDINWSDVQYTGTRQSIFSIPAGYTYSPFSIGFDFISSMLYTDYNLPSNPTLALTVSLLTSEKIGWEMEYRIGMGLPSRTTIDGYSDATYRQYLISSFGGHFVYYPFGQIKFAPLIGIFYRSGKGNYYIHSAYEHYDLDPETGDRTVWADYHNDYELDENSYNDYGMIFGYRFNLTKSINFEMKVPVFNTNYDSKLYKSHFYTDYLSTESENYRLDYTSETDYRRLAIGFSFVVLYRFKGQPVSH